MMCDSTTFFPWVTYYIYGSANFINGYNISKTLYKIISMMQYTILPRLILIVIEIEVISTNPIWP